MDRRYAVTISGPGWSVTSEISADDYSGDAAIAMHLHAALVMASSQIASMPGLLAGVVATMAEEGIGDGKTEEEIAAQAAFFVAAAELVKQREIERR